MPKQLPDEDQVRAHFHSISLPDLKNNLATVRLVTQSCKALGQRLRA